MFVLPLVRLNLHPDGRMEDAQGLYFIQLLNVVNSNICNLTATIV